MVLYPIAYVNFFLRLCRNLSFNLLKYYTLLSVPDQIYCIVYSRCLSTIMSHLELNCLQGLPYCRTYTHFSTCLSAPAEVLLNILRRNQLPPQDVLCYCFIFLIKRPKNSVKSRLCGVLLTQKCRESTQNDGQNA